MSDPADSASDLADSGVFVAVDVVLAAVVAAEESD